MSSIDPISSPEIQEVREILGRLGSTIYVLEDLWINDARERGAFIRDLRPVSRIEYDYRMSDTGKRERFEAFWIIDVKHENAPTLKEYIDALTEAEVFVDRSNDHDEKIRAAYPEYADRDQFPFFEWVNDVDDYDKRVFTKIDVLQPDLMTRLVEHVSFVRRNHLRLVSSN
jgi:hypothetical protein